MKTCYLIVFFLMVSVFTSADTNKNGGMPSISINNQSSQEGDLGEYNQIVFTVSLSNPTDQAVSVQYANSEETAIADFDYITVGGVLTFPAFTTSQELTFEIIGDEIDESDEIFHVELFSATNATISNGTGIATILDDDETPTISLKDVSLVEGDVGNSTLNFTVTASHSSASNMTFNYQSTDGSATSASDYVLASGTATITAKSLETSIDVEVMGDYLIESDESFNLVLSEVSNAIVDDNTAIAIIQNDDEGADLAITMTVTPELAEVTDILTYSLRIINNGPELAIDTLTTINIFEKVELIDASSSQGSCNHVDSIVSCLMGDVAIGKVIDIIIHARIVLAGNINTEATVASNTSDDANFSNNTTSFVVTSTALNIPMLSVWSLLVLILLVLFFYFRKTRLNA